MRDFAGCRHRHDRRRDSREGEARGTSKARAGRAQAKASSGPTRAQHVLDGIGLPQTKAPATPEASTISEGITPKPATAASAKPEVAEAPSIMAETANPITGRAIAGEALGDETPHSDFDGLKLRGVRARVVHHHPGPPCFATPATPHHRCPSIGGAGPSPGRLCSTANFAGP